MKHAFAHAVWRDPVEVYRLDKKYKGTPYCGSNRDIPFFTPGDITEQTIGIAVDELVRVFGGIPEDTFNDTADRTNIAVPE